MSDWIKNRKCIVVCYRYNFFYKCLQWCNVHIFSSAFRPTGFAARETSINLPWHLSDCHVMALIRAGLAITANLWLRLAMVGWRLSARRTIMREWLMSRTDPFYVSLKLRGSLDGPCRPCTGCLFMIPLMVE